MEADLDEDQLKQRMVQDSALVVGAGDASKFGHEDFHAFALSHEIDCLISDASATNGAVVALRGQGIVVYLV